MRNRIRIGVVLAVMMSAMASVVSVVARAEGSCPGGFLLVPVANYPEVLAAYDANNNGLVCSLAPGLPSGKKKALPVVVAVDDN